MLRIRATCLRVQFCVKFAANVPPVIIAIVVVEIIRRDPRFVSIESNLEGLPESDARAFLKQRGIETYCRRVGVYAPTVKVARKNYSRAAKLLEELRNSDSGPSV